MSLIDAVKLLLLGLAAAFAGIGLSQYPITHEWRDLLWLGIGGLPLLVMRKRFSAIYISFLLTVTGATAAIKALYFLVECKLQSEHCESFEKLFQFAPIATYASYLIAGLAIYVLLKRATPAENS